MYQVKRSARSAFVPIRTQRYHVWTWGEPSPDTPPLVLAHGWMDIGASYQFMVDALSEDFARGRHIVAADWRGYGLSSGPETDHYWFPDYMADLDFLLDHYSPDRPVDLVGHSMGGAVVTHYTGARPHRVRRLVNLEGFGQPVSSPAAAPARYGKWMDQLRAFHTGEIVLKAYDSQAGVARRLAKTNPRLARDQAGRDKAEWLAGHWSQEKAPGRWEILGDAAHKIMNAQVTRLDETLETYKRISMPMLAVEASDDSLEGWFKGRFTLAEYHERLKSVPDCRIAVVQDAGHMLHHDQPEQLAGLLEDFLR